MIWPFEAMVVCFVMLVVAAIGGLFTTIARRYFWVSLGIAVVATLVFGWYERLVHRAARLGDPLIRVDLLLLDPLLWLVWIFQASAAVRYLLSFWWMRRSAAT